MYIYMSCFLTWIKRATLSMLWTVLVHTAWGKTQQGSNIWSSNLHHCHTYTWPDRMYKSCYSGECSREIIEINVLGQRKRRFFPVDVLSGFQWGRHTKFPWFPNELFTFSYQLVFLLLLFFSSDMAREIFPSLYDLWLLHSAIHIDGSILDPF